MISEYYLNVDWNYVYKKLKKYPRNIISIVKRDITLLKYNPESGDKLDSFKTATLYKKRYQEIEAYYTVEVGVVQVLGFEYLGKINLEGIESGIKSGKYTKHTTTKQQNTIKAYKKKFRQKYI